MATKWISPTWRMPDEQNQSKFDNYGLSLNGQDESINCGNIPALISSSNFTISGWFTQTTLNQTRILFGTRGGNPDTVGIYTYTDGFMYIDVKNGSASYGKFDYSTVISADTWFHLAMVFDGSGSANADRLKLYINNSEVTLTYNSTIPASTSSTALDFKLGIVEGLNDEWLGKMAQVAVFDYTLSTNQINYLYNSGTPVNPMAISGNAPIAYYPLGGSSTGSASTLTVPNESVPSATVFNFDTSDSINTKTISEFGITGEFTVSMWLNATTLNGYATPLWASDGTFINGFGFFYNSSRFHFFVDHYITYGVVQTGTSTTNVWYHLVGTFSSSGTVKLYIDGVANGTPKTGATLDGLNNTLIISKGAAVAGDITNVQLWNKELIDTEITTLYNNGVPLLSGTQPQTANLRAWYPMDVSNANWEADTASTWQIADAVSSYPQSFDFPNVSGNNANGIEVSNPPRPQSQITISKWINPSSTQLAYAHTLATNGSAGSGTLAYGFYFQPASQYRFWIYTTNGNGASAAPGINVPKNQWSHIVGTYDGSNVKIYLNGVQQGADAAYTGDLSYDTSASLYIGREARTSPTNYWGYNGEISNVMIFDTALPATGTESVATLYNNGVPLTSAIATSNLKAWYKLNDNELFDGTNWSVENQAYPAGFDSALRFTTTAGATANSPIISNSTTHSTSWWAKYDTYATREDLILTTSTLNGYLMYVNNGGLIAFRPTTGSALTSSPGSTYKAITINNTGKWYHYVFIRNGGNVKLYENNTKVWDATMTAGTESVSTQLIQGFASKQSYTGSTSNYSNFSFFDTAISESDVQALYNNGTPLTDVSSITSMNNWYKLNNLTSGLQDSVGSNNATATGTVAKVNTFVSTEAGISSGMTEQNLVNNNVSTLNGTSSGMTTANLVNSDLTRSIPYSSYSIDFDGTGDYVECGSSSYLNSISNLTVSAWVNAEDYTAGANGQFLVNDWNYNTANGHFRFYLEGGKLKIGIKISSSDYAINETNAFTFTNGEWYHVAFVYNGALSGSTNITKLYVNGVSQSITNSYETMPTSLQNSSSTINIARFGSTSPRLLNGKMSNVAIWSSSLTDNQMLTIYNGGVPNDISSLSPVGWWSLAGDSYYNGTNFICPDLSTNSNNGTTTGMGGTELIGNGPGSTSNGIATSMNIPENLQGNAPNSTKNAFSINMTEIDRETSVPS